MGYDRSILRVRNIHERALAVPAVQAGALLDRLASPTDLIWPKRDWPAMRFDRPLQQGAVGGHGPIRYSVESYEPGRLIRFRFSAPRGFDGTHAFEVLATSDNGVTLRHELLMDARGPALFTWPLLYRPLHDALLEDALDNAERVTGGHPLQRHWSLSVRVLRAILRARRRPRL